jgi:hypothetical protein
MAARPRFALVLALLGLVVAVLAGCGGSGDAASSSTPVDQLLRETFSNDHAVKSGVLDLTLRVDAQGSQQVQGPVTVHLTGPFESQGTGKLPKFHFDAALQGAGQDLSAGATATGDKGYVSFQGTNYVVSDNVFKQFRTGYEQAQSRSQTKPGQSLSALGIDPSRWLTNPRNAGEGKVGDTDVIRITGGVDVAKLLDDVNTLLERTRSLDPGAAQGVPQRLTQQQRQQAQKAIRNVAIELDTGKDDKILRRTMVDLDLQLPQGSSAATSASVRLDLQLKDVNQGQDIAAPADPKPFAELLNSLGALGIGAGGTGTGTGTGGTGATGGASADNLKQYSDCIAAAGNDAAKARKCADLLTP